MAGADGSSPKEDGNYFFAFFGNVEDKTDDDNPCFVFLSSPGVPEPCLRITQIIDQQLVVEKIDLSGATYHILKSMDKTLMMKAYMDLPRRVGQGLTFKTTHFTFESDEDKKAFQNQIKAINQLSGSKNPRVQETELKEIMPEEPKVTEKKKPSTKKKNSTKSQKPSPLLTSQSTRSLLKDTDHESAKGRTTSDAEPPMSPGPTVESNETHINQDHNCFELTFDMMLGIRTAVSRLGSLVDTEELTEQDFGEETKMRFPKRGSSRTPAHNQADFYFKDYCPKVFRMIRELYGIQNTDYLINLCGNFAFLEFISNSKSGEFFFFSHDKQFMIKTISHHESKLLFAMMKEYYAHLTTYPGTMIVRFYGMHKVVTHDRSRPYYFLIMSSVTYTDCKIHRLFDLKGSEVGRSASRKEKEKKDGIVYKDNDFRDQGIQLELNEDKSEFLEQIKRDSELLKRLKIMDYSLLLGIHDPSLKTDEAAARSDQEDVKEEAATTPSDDPSDLATQTVEAQEKDKLRSSAAELSSLEMSPQLDMGMLPDIDSTQIRKMSCVTFDFKVPEFPEMRPSATISIPNKQQDTGEKTRCKWNGYKSKSGKIYFAGIIDILIQYNYRKQFETKFKSFKHDKEKLSAVDPVFYADRFCKFMEASTT